MCAIWLPRVLVRKHKPYSKQRRSRLWSKPVNLRTWGLVSDPIAMVQAFAELRYGVVAHTLENSVKYGHNLGHTPYAKPQSEHSLTRDTQWVGGSHKRRLKKRAANRCVQGAWPVAEAKERWTARVRGVWTREGAVHGVQRGARPRGEQKPKFQKSMLQPQLQPV